MLWWVLGSRWPIYTTNFSPFVFFMHTDLKDLHSRIWNLHSICINNRSRLHNCRLLLGLLPTCSFNKRKLLTSPTSPPPTPPTHCSPFKMKFFQNWVIHYPPVDNASLIMLHGMIEHAQRSIHRKAIEHWDLGIQTTVGQLFFFFHVSMGRRVILQKNVIFLT